MTQEPAAPARIGVTDTERLSLTEKLSYGAGDLACNLSWNMVSSFLLFFYTDVAGIAAAVAGVLLLVARILDALIDPVIGMAVDRTKSRFGKSRPYLRYGAVPFGVLSVLTFLSPDLGETGKVIYAGVTFLILGLVYSVVNVPYGAMLPMMVREPHQRMQLSGFRAVGTAVGTIVMTALTMPLVNLLGGGSEHRGWALSAIVFAVLSTGLLLVTYRNCHERYSVTSDLERKNLGKALRNLLRNGPWLVAFCFGLVNFIRLGVVLAVTVYFALTVLHKPWMISVLLPLVVGGLLVGGPLAPAFYRWAGGKRRGNIIALSAAIVLWALLPLTANIPAAFIAVFVVAAVAIGLSMTSLYAIVADSVDYQQWRYGNRNEGLLSAGISFSTKIGMALGSAIVALALGAAGYNPDQVSTTATTTIAVLFYATPIVLMTLQILCMSFYRIDSLYPRIAAELREQA